MVIGDCFKSNESKTIRNYLFKLCDQKLTVSSSLRSVLVTVTSGTGYPPTVQEKVPGVELSSSLGAVTDTDSFSGEGQYVRKGTLGDWVTII